MRLKGMCRMRRKLLTPLVILGLTDLVLVTDCSHRFTLQAFKQDAGLGLSLPFPSVHG
jgi:hypothetical protein